MLGIPKKVDCILAEFTGPNELLQAAGKMREAGYTKFDCHAPFPIHGLSEVMRLKGSPVGWITGICGILGAGGGLALQWYALSLSYPMVISGKPFFAFQAYVPVTFALGVLGGAFAAILSMLILNRLPRLNHPLFNSERFRQFSNDKFFVSVDGDDPKYNETATTAFLISIGGKDPEVLKDE